MNVRWLVLDLKVQKCTDIESMPGFQRPAYCNRTSVRFALCVSQMRLEMETSKAAIKWMELHFDTGGACQVHIGNALVEVFPRRIWYLVQLNTAVVVVQLYPPTYGRTAVPISG